MIKGNTYNNMTYKVIYVARRMVYYLLTIRKYEGFVKCHIIHVAVIYGHYTNALSDNIQR
ncbi:hypothetical protein NARC_30267 [Candidatus Nitrosocosmicus arcticus]|uniref:Uncharacterized protein n=1 Tax=Candidatus Nitrosocosmicus arcticus TaxID=2035267 RepID=A0A557SY83_9ARCH|nr:hypothetical protein NARC_30267 [Candidatus Nitrosocosmicus arcticus]